MTNTELRVFLMGDGVDAAMANQRLPDGYYHLDQMIGSAARHGTDIGCCATCTDARGINDDMLTKGTRRSTLEELAEWTCGPTRSSRSSGTVDGPVQTLPGCCGEQPGARSWPIAVRTGDGSEAPAWLAEPNGGQPAIRDQLQHLAKTTTCDHAGRAHGRGVRRRAHSWAVSILLDELADRRGAYCVLAHDAFRLLHAHGRSASRLADGKLERHFWPIYPVHHLSAHALVSASTSA